MFRRSRLLEGVLGQGVESSSSRAAQTATVEDAAHLVGGKPHGPDSCCSSCILHLHVVGLWLLLRRCRCWLSRRSHRFSCCGCQGVRGGKSVGEIERREQPILTLHNEVALDILTPWSLAHGAHVVIAKPLRDAVEVEDVRALALGWGIAEERACEQRPGCSGCGRPEKRLVRVLTERTVRARSLARRACRVKVVLADTAHVVRVLDVPDCDSEVEAEGGVDHVISAAARATIEHASITHPSSRWRASGRRGPSSRLNACWTVGTDADRLAGPRESNTCCARAKDARRSESESFL